MNNTQDFNPSEFFNQKEIGGSRYTITALNGWDAWDGWTLILETVAPVFGEVLDSKNVDSELLQYEKQDTFKSILALVAKNINTHEMRVLISKMLNGATKDGVVLDIDKDFRGKAHLMMELVMYCLEVNFKGFFTESDMFQSTTGMLGKILGSTQEE